MSIKHKLTWMMMGISLAAIVLTVTAITAYLIYDMHGSKQKELAVTATLAGDRNSAALAFLDNARVRSNLDIFRLSPAIKLACIYDERGSYFAGYETRDTSPAQGCPASAGVIPAAMEGLFTAQSAIAQKGQRIGTVFMASDTRDIDEYVRKALLISVTVAVLVSAVVLMLAIYLQRTISRPILELAAVAQKITRERDYTLEANASYPDETGTLARAFNAMLGEVRLRDSELRTANETLEFKVSERTQQLEFARQRAEAANQAKTEFLSNMSHEFRTPLHAIVSFASYGIREHDTSAPVQLKQYFELIQKGASRISKLVGEVLDLARLEQGEQVFWFQRSSIIDMVGRAAEMVRPMLNEKHIGLHFQHEAAAVMLVCDHDKIIQVLTNLLTNAIKFTPPGGSIFVCTGGYSDINAEGVSVSVRDEGVGIPAGEEEMIFESFRQSSRTNTGAGGTGLGLAICRNIIRGHNGTIRAQNNDSGQGACVTFALPLSLPEGQHIIHTQTVEERHEHAA